MRRLRPMRRRAQQRAREEQTPSPASMPEADLESFSSDEPDEIVPFVPVSREYDSYEHDETDTSDEAFTPPAIAQRRRLRRPSLGLRHPVLGIEIKASTLLLATGLIAGGIFGTLLKQGEIRQSLEEWWPLALLMVAGLWMLIALIRRRVASFLGGAALAGVGLSLLMDTQAIAVFEDTLLGIVLVTLGLGIVIRGFLLRQQNSL
jgi:hypothetical protein